MSQFLLPDLGEGLEEAQLVQWLVQVGDADSEAGRGGADAFWAWLGARSPLRVYDVVRSHDGFVASHAAPKQTTPIARMSFWAPLDRLVGAIA